METGTSTWKMENLFGGYRLTARQRVYVLEHFLEQAKLIDAPPIVAMAIRALAHDRPLVPMEQVRKFAARNSYGSGSTELDLKLTRGVSALESYLMVKMAMASSDPEAARAAERLHARLFPFGVAAITRARFVQKHVDVKDMLTRLDDPEVVADVARLPEMPALVSHVRSLNEEFGKSLKEYTRVPDRDEMRKLQDRGHSLLLHTVAQIIAYFGEGDAAKEAQRDSLLEPLFRQYEELSKQHKRRAAGAPSEDEAQDPGDTLELPMELPAEPPVEQAAQAIMQAVTPEVMTPPTRERPMA